MTIAIPCVSQLSDQDLLAHVPRAAEHERDATAQLIALLMELDTRRLYLAEGCSSLFTYCTQILHLSEHAAYARIEAARAARRFPIVLERLAEGSVSLTVIGLLSPHLSETNHLEVLEAVRHKSKRDVEHLVARLHVVPFATGGETTTENLELRCRAHDVYEAEQYFGSGPAPVVRETRVHELAHLQLGPDRVALGEGHVRTTRTLV